MSDDERTTVARELRDHWERTIPAAPGWEDLPPQLTYRAPDLFGADAPQGRSSSFRRLQEIGRGGFGVIHEAQQDDLRRIVAVKRLDPQRATPAARDAFVIEALVTAHLEHPNIVPVHALGLDEEDGLYLAMKLVKGASWKQILEPATAVEKQLAEHYDLERHLDVLGGVCNAVAFAHSRGIIHRDLKPANVMVGEFGEVLLMDWGLALAFEDRPELAAIPSVKSVKAPSGTPSYMAPEMARSPGEPLGPWTDVYLLGALLHEILTGKPPHDGPSLVMVLLAAGRAEPPTFAPETPEELARICTRAMAADPTERFESAETFAAAIEGYRSHRESRLVESGARDALARVAARPRSDTATDPAGASQEVYPLLAEAVAGFRQALALWGGNADARTGLGDARRRLVEAALDAGDVALAEAHLEELAGDGLPVDDLRKGLDRAHARRERLAAAARDRAAAERRTRKLRTALTLSGAGAVFVLAVGLLVLLDQRGRLTDALERETAASGEQRIALEREQAALDQARQDRDDLSAEKGKVEAALAGRDEALAGERGAMARMRVGALASACASEATRDPSLALILGVRAAEARIDADVVTALHAALARGHERGVIGDLGWGSVVDAGMVEERAGVLLISSWRDRRKRDLPAGVFAMAGARTQMSLGAVDLRAAQPIMTTLAEGLVTHAPGFGDYAGVLVPSLSRSGRFAVTPSTLARRSGLTVGSSIVPIDGGAPRSIDPARAAVFERGGDGVAVWSPGEIRLLDTHGRVVDRIGHASLDDAESAPYMARDGELVAWCHPTGKALFVRNARGGPIREITRDDFRGMRGVSVSAELGRVVVEVMRGPSEGPLRHGGLVLDADGGLLADLGRSHRPRLDPSHPWITDLGGSVWNLAGERVLKLKAVVGMAARSVVPRGLPRFSATGSRVGVFSRNGVRTAPLDGGEPIEIVHTAEVLDFAFDPTGDAVATTSTDGVIRVWTVSGELVRMFRAPPRPQDAVVWTGDGRGLVTVGRDGIVHSWDIAGGEVGSTLRLRDPLDRIRVSRDGWCVVTAAGEIEWFGPDDRRIGALSIPPTALDRIDCSVEGGELLVFRANGTVRRFAESGGMALGPGSDGRAHRHPAGVLVGDEKNLRRVGPGGEWEARTRGTNAVSVAADTGFVAGVWGERLVLMDADLAQMAERVVADCSRTAISADGARVASISAKGVAVWTDELLPVFTLPDPAPQLTAMALSHDGGLLALGRTDGTASLNAADGVELCSFPALGGSITAVAFSADGSRLITGTREGEVRTWLTDPAAVVELAKSRISRELTSPERLRYADLLGD